MSKRSYRLGRVSFNELNHMPYDTKFSETLIDQYHLKMNLIDPLWCVAPSKFAKDREVHSPSVQIKNGGQKLLNIFGGSTSWGWGLESEETTLHGRLANFCNAQVYNYSQPAWNIFDSLTFIRRRPNLISEDSTTIFILGINEFHLSLTRNQDFLNTRGMQIIDRIGDIGCNYYNAAPTWMNILEVVKSRVLQDLKFVCRSLLKSKKLVLPNTTVVAPEYERRCLTIITSACLNIQEVMRGRPYIVYFEPSIFDKIDLTSDENSIVRENESRKNHWKTFHSVVSFETQKNKSLYLFSNVEKLGHYFDYCHPDKCTTKAIAEEICDILKQVET